MEVAYFVGLEIRISLSNVQIAEAEEILKILVPCKLCKILLNLHLEIHVQKFLQLLIWHSISWRKSR